jgi:hypothetical protein
MVNLGRHCLGADAAMTVMQDLCRVTGGWRTRVLLAAATTLNVWRWVIFLNARRRPS